LICIKSVTEKEKPEPGKVDELIMRIKEIDRQRRKIPKAKPAKLGK
jgi:hypothetical protein